MTTTTEVSATLLAKEDRLKELLRGYGSLAVAYSGGVDSAYLADVAAETLPGCVRLILADSPSIPRSELKEAVALAEARGWPLEVIETREYENEQYLANDGTRCYFCRTELFDKMQAYADEQSIARMAYGAIVDDLADTTRVGHKAAQERSVVAPLQEAGLSKDDIRALSRRRGLPTHSKASFACLASRIPKGTPVSLEALSQVERAEEVVKGLGFTQYRCRHHGDLVRIEVEPGDLPRFLEPATRDRILRGCRDAGYKHVTLDLAGYRTGSTA